MSTTVAPSRPVTAESPSRASSASNPNRAATDPTPLRPSWRGLIHRYGVAVFLPASIVLIASTPTTNDRVAVIVYVFGVTTMLGVSAVYHCGRLRPSTMKWMKRIDHTTILLAIAGSYTAIAILALPAENARNLLVFSWVATIVGAAIRMLWLRAPYPVVAVVYVAVGWGALLEWSALVSALSGAQLALLLGGGIVYTFGAGVYALHRPNPWPATFGYHEVFHALVMIGVGAHFLLVLTLVLRSR